MCSNAGTAVTWSRLRCCRGLLASALGMISLALLLGSAALALSSSVSASPVFDYAYDDWASTSATTTDSAADLAAPTVRTPAFTTGYVYDSSHWSVATNALDDLAEVGFRSDTSHIFRDAPGHLVADTAENRALIQSALSPENLRTTITLPDGSTLAQYFRTLPDGTQGVGRGSQRLGDHEWRPQCHPPVIRRLGRSLSLLEKHST